MTTTLGAAAGCLTTAAIGYVEKQYIDPGYVYNGVLAGLVSITSPCAVVSPWGAIIVGAIGAFVYVGASKGVKAAGIDDAVDAFAVHGACGFWGCIAVGLFHPDLGCVTNMMRNGEFTTDLLVTQIKGAASLLMLGAVPTLILCHVLQKMNFLRTCKEEEEMGLDLWVFQISAYTVSPAQR